MASSISQVTARPPRLYRRVGFEEHIRDSPTRIRVLCVDDHPFTQLGVAATLGDQPDMQLVAEASDGRSAVQAHREHRPDVTVMDLEIPDMSGIDAVAKIRTGCPQAKIIVLASHERDAQVIRAMKAGASGYLLKSMPAQELVRCIRIVVAGKRYIPPEVAIQLAGHVVSDALSLREVEVLNTIAAGNSNKIVADKLRITEDTVKGHVSRIMSKLRANDRTHAVLIALRRGILDIPKPNNNC
ncbi:MAG: response regulator transcription factor [Acidobacteriaceae bacterium]